MIRFIVSIHWFDSFLRFLTSLPYFASLSQFIGSIHWLSSLVRFIASIHWFDPLIRFIDSIHWLDSLIRFMASFIRRFKLRIENEDRNGFGLHFRFRAPNPLFYRCKLLPYQKQDLKNDICWKKTNENETAYATAGALAVNVGHALCVVSVYLLFWLSHENPIDAEPLLGN